MFLDKSRPIIHGELSGVPWAPPSLSRLPAPRRASYAFGWAPLQVGAPSFSAHQCLASLQEAMTQVPSQNHGQLIKAAFVDTGTGSVCGHQERPSIHDEGAARTLQINARGFS